jgi:hypothetical protein
MKLIRRRSIDHESDLALVGERNVSGNGHSTCTRQSGKPCGDGVLHFMTLFGGVSLPIECGSDNEHILRIKAEWNFEHPDEAL